MKANRLMAAVVAGLDAALWSGDLPAELDRLASEGLVEHSSGTLLLRRMLPTANRASIDRFRTAGQPDSWAKVRFEWFVNGLHMEDFVSPGHPVHGRDQLDAMLPATTRFARRCIEMAEARHGAQCLAFLMIGDLESGIAFRFWQRRPGAEQFEADDMVSACALPAMLLGVEDVDDTAFREALVNLQGSAE